MAAAKDERLIRAARAGDLHQVEALLAAGTVVDETDSAGTTALMFAAQERNARLVQVSSAEPGDGKTTSICNLALAIAQSGKRVLLIDADLRRPTVHEMFRLPQEAGLSDALRLACGFGYLQLGDRRKGCPLGEGHATTARLGETRLR